MNTYIAGTLVTVTLTFLNLSNVPTDPTTITVKWSYSGAVSTTVWVYPTASQLTRVSTGVYAAAIDTTGNPGTYTVEGIGTGAVQVTGVDSFLVNPAPL